MDEIETGIVIKPVHVLWTISNIFPYLAVIGPLKTRHPRRFDDIIWKKYNGRV